MACDRYLELLSARLDGELTEAQERELKEQQRKIEKSQTDAMRYYEDYVSGTLSKDQFLERKSDCRKTEEDAKLRVALLREQLKHMTDETVSAESVIQSAEPLGKYFNVDKLSPELMRELVQRIIIYPGGAIHIDWNFGEVLQMQVSDADA